jgi:hypothetical protein
MTIEDDIAFLDRIPFLRRLGPSALHILAIGAEGYQFAPARSCSRPVTTPIALTPSRKVHSRSSPSTAKPR